MTLLGSLPKSYENFVLSLMTLKEDELTMKYVVNRLIQEAYVRKEFDEMLIAQETKTNVKFGKKTLEKHFCDGCKKWCCKNMKTAMK